MLSPSFTSNVFWRQSLQSSSMQRGRVKFFIQSGPTSSSPKYHKKKFVALSSHLVRLTTKRLHSLPKEEKPHKQEDFTYSSVVFHAPNHGNARFDALSVWNLENSSLAAQNTDVYFKALSIQLPGSINFEVFLSVERLFVSNFSTISREKTEQRFSLNKCLY